jgi:hypothetical protein
MSSRTRQTVGVGAIVLVASVVVMSLPLLVRTGTNGKYIIALAFVGAAVGFSILANGAIDWLRGK